MGDVYGSAKVRVYCRTASCCPRFTDEDRYPLAASAEGAGMLACRQCRPYRLPPALARGRGAPELVCRGIRLIVDGALDEGTEASLAARLGVSGRHLRRLFMTHLGVTPDFLARSCRAHFARRLLDDTDISVTDVAFAAGYGSARQFNREFKRIFRDTPSRLRAGPVPGGRRAADGALTLRLWFTGALDWDALTAFLAARAVPEVEQVDGRTYRRTIMVAGDPGFVELSPGGRDYLNLRVRLPHWASLMHVADRARKIAGLDELLVPGCWDPFEVGVAAIIEHYEASPAWRPIMHRLVSQLGRPVPGHAPSGLTRTFPEPGVVARAGTSLEAVSLTRTQAKAVASFASAVEHDAIRLDGSMTSGQLIGAITAVPGVSASTAEYLALRMGEPAEARTFLPDRSSVGG